MKKMMISAAMVALLLVGFQACKQKTADAQAKDSTECLNDGHNSQNSLDWAGTYTGVTPCADCAGIEVKLVLNADETYTLTNVYQDKKGEPFVSSGKFAWDETGSVITLDGKDAPTKYKVGENQLLQLDLAGNVIDGEHADMYILSKISE